MKKTIVALSGIILVAFLVIFVANAQNKDPEGKKKECTEVAKECGKCPAASTACAKAVNTADASGTKKCDPAKCKEAGCDQAKCKAEGCNPANCKQATAEVKSCPQAKCKMLTEK